MTIVEKLRKLITTKGGDPTGVMTIAEGVDRLEKTEEGGGGSGGPEAVYLYISPHVEYDSNIGKLRVIDYYVYTNPDKTDYIYDIDGLYNLGIIGSSLTPKALYLVDVDNADLISLYPATVHMTYNETMENVDPVFSTMPIHRKFDNPDLSEAYETTYQLFGSAEIDAETGTTILILNVHELSN